VEKNGRGLFKVLFWYLRVGTDKNHENLSQDSGSPGRDFKPVVTVRFGKLKMQLWDSMYWPHVNPVPSGAVGKDCHRRLLSRPRFVRAVAPRIFFMKLQGMRRNILQWHTSGVDFYTPLPSFMQLYYVPFKKALWLFVQPLLHKMFKFSVGSKTICRVRQYLPMFKLQRGNVCTWVVMQETHAFGWMTLSFWAEGWL
jgi:hypothetical protein